MGGLHVGHPVADRRRHRLLERPRARLHRAHLGAQQVHPLHVRALAAHVLGAHVHDALEPEQRAGRGAGHAVLARAGLGDHARLAHPPGQQALPEGVVELVRAGVEQVLALEVHLAAGGRREPRSAVERRGPPGEVAQQPAELLLERGIGARGEPLALELVERGHERLRARSGPRRGRSAARAAGCSCRRARGVRRRRPPPGRTRPAWRGPCGPAPPRCRWRCPRRTAGWRRSPRPRSPGSSPPESTSGGVPPCSWRTSAQSKLSPVPPGATLRVGVEQVEVGAEGPQRAHLGGVPHARRLDHPAAGAPRGLAAVGGALVAVQLEQREAAAVGGGGHLVEGGVHEHARDLRAAMQLGADQLGVLDRRRPAGCPARRSGRPPRRRARRSRRASSARGDSTDLDARHRANGRPGPLGRGDRAAAAARVRVRLGRLPSFTRAVRRSSPR